jgi:hypothetical protein
VVCYLLFVRARSPFQAYAILLGVYRLHFIKHSPAGLLWTSDQPVAEADSYTTPQQTQGTNTHALRRIRIRYSNSQPVADLHLRQHGQPDRLWFITPCRIRVRPGYFKAQITFVIRLED